MAERSQDATAGYLDSSRHPTQAYTFQTINHGQSDEHDVSRISHPFVPSSTYNASTIPSAITQDLPPAYTPQANFLPMVIPQVATSWQGAFMCPFTRAYPPGIQDRGITETEFLHFIDGFNEAFVASPVFQATNMIGVVMGQAYGVDPVQIAGTALSLASGVASAGISFVRAKRYMKRANQDLFHPAGLHGQVLTTKKLLANIGYPEQKVQLLPINHEQRGPDIEPPTAAVPGTQAISRRHQALEGYVQPLSLDVPPSAASQNLLKRMGEWQAKRLADRQRKKLDRERRKGEKKGQEKDADALKKEREMNNELAKVESKFEKSQRKADRKVSKERAKGKFQEADKAVREFEKEGHKFEEERSKVIRKGEREIQKYKSEGDHERGKSDKKEQKMANKVRWIVIGNWDPETAGDEMEDEDSTTTS